MAKNKKSIVKNIIGIIVALIALSEMIQLIQTASRNSSTIAYLGAGSCGILAMILIIYNGIQIRKKKGLGGSGAKKADKSKPATSRPRPRSGSSAEADEVFISEIQEGRCFDTFAYDDLGVAEIYVDVEYEDGVSYIKPEIEVTYDKDNVKTQADVDAYDDIVVDEYQKQFEEMVEICEAWGVQYDIAEPQVTTNIKNGKIS